MAEVVWTRAAIAQVGAITAFIAESNPRAAARVSARLVAAADGLELFPDRGRRLDATRRELTTVFPYLIRYEHSDDVVRITGVRHGARRPGD